MPYIIIAFGLVMSCFGGLAMANGSTIIQVERGWSLFIGGSALLSGGIVTMAIGVATKALIDRTVALAVQPASFGERVAPALPAGTSTASTEGVVGSTVASSAVADPAIAPVVAPALSEHREDIPAKLYEPSALVAGAVPPGVEDVPGAAYPEMEPAPTSQEIERDPRHNTSAVPEAAVPVNDADEPTPTRERLLRRLSPRPKPETPIDIPRQAQDREDEALAEQPPVPSIAADTSLDHPDGSSAAYDPAGERHPPSPQPVDAPSIVGRYEADGTSYVMYSDGSIEAQSAAGVYRFASMAELKSFIES